MIRVLQISDSLKQRFGVTAFLMNYNSAIDTNRVVFDYLILDSEPEITKKIQHYGGQIYTMPKLGICNYIEFRRVIENFFREHHYEIVHSHFYQIDPIVKKIAVKNGTKHYISHAHATKYADTKSKALRNFILSFPIRFTSTEYCGCSKAACDFLFGKQVLGIRKKEAVIIPNAVDYAKFTFDQTVRAKIRDNLGIEDCIVFGNIGSLKPAKNQSFLLEVFREILSQESKAVLVIVGDGSLKDELKAKAKHLEILKNVIFIGETDRPQEYYNAFDCYVFPSIYEGFGMSLLEAEINGLPCVCSDKIPPNAIISSSVKVLPIDNVKNWKEACIEMTRVGRADSVIDSIYDLKYAAEVLMRYYEHL